MVRQFRFVVVVIVALLASVLAGAQEQEKANYHNPNIPDARSDSEVKALAYMKTVLYAQNLYRKKHKKYAPSLMALVGSGSFTRRMVSPDRGDYTASFARGFSLQMMPKTQDSTHRSFWVNESGTIRAEEDKPATAESPVLKPDSQ
ncbi:MAG TPA: hypothetical protein VK738_08225 [Terriglobales bacterium]|jgi:hypothetical protein|nr:hypothetical protein [Terriglobales bacterium]